jgi:AcrR family transcriptional regulator
MAARRAKKTKARPAAGERPARSRARDLPKSQETRALILEAAVDAIARDGIAGANLTNVARIAGVTRGCIQYYFATTADIVVALTQYVEDQNWKTYVASVERARGGRNLIEVAIDMVGQPIEDRYRAARLELIMAARTTPKLRPLLERAARDIEDAQRAFTDEMFGKPGIADTARFRGARDLTRIISEWMFLHIFPDDDRAERVDGVREALRVALHTLWGVEDGKGRRKRNAR